MNYQKGISIRIFVKYLKARLAVCFGGRVAEELIFGKDNISTGAGGGSGFRY